MTTKEELSVYPGRCCTVGELYSCHTDCTSRVDQPTTQLILWQNRTPSSNMSASHQLCSGSWCLSCAGNWLSDLTSYWVVAGVWFPLQFPRWKSFGKSTRSEFQI